MGKNRYRHGAAILVLMAGSAGATITVDTTVATDWKISNGVVSLDWNSTSGNIYSIHLAGHPEDIIDVTNTSGGRPKGFYMDNTGLGSGTLTASFDRDGDRYVDWWTTVVSNSTNPFTYSQHFVLTDNDPGIHAYFVVNHGPGDIAGAIGQIQFVFRVNLALFPNTYSVNSGLGNLGPTAVTLPPPDISGTADPGRQVQDATVDLHGFSLPDGFRRQFYTKYDYSSYEYLHKVHGVFGSTLAAWTILPSTESLIGGPTKQDLIFTNNILIMECQSNHLNNGFAFPVAAGDSLNRLYGPFYFRFSAFDSQHPTAASLYQDALGTAPAVRAFYDSEDTLLQNGYVASNGRGKVRVKIEEAAWVVLSDPKTNFQYSHLGAQFWANSKGRGAALMKGVIPGTYRLSAFVLGEWGELRRDDVSVAARQDRNFAGELYARELRIRAAHLDNRHSGPLGARVSSRTGCRGRLHAGRSRVLGQLGLLVRLRGQSWRGDLLCNAGRLDAGNQRSQQMELRPVAQFLARLVCGNLQCLRRHHGRL